MKCLLELVRGWAAGSDREAALAVELLVFLTGTSIRDFTEEEEEVLLETIGSCSNAKCLSLLVQLALEEEISWPVEEAFSTFLTSLASLNGESVGTNQIYSVADALIRKGVSPERLLGEFSALVPERQVVAAVSSIAALRRHFSEEQLRLAILDRALRTRKDVLWHAVMICDPSSLKAYGHGLGPVLDRYASLATALDDWPYRERGSTGYIRAIGAVSQGEQASLERFGVAADRFMRRHAGRGIEGLWMRSAEASSFRGELLTQVFPGGDYFSVIYDIPDSLSGVGAESFEEPELSDL